MDRPMTVLPNAAALAEALGENAKHGEILVKVLNDLHARRPGVTMHVSENGSIHIPADTLEMLRTDKDVRREIVARAKNRYEKSTARARQEAEDAQRQLLLIQGEQVGKPIAEALRNATQQRRAEEIARRQAERPELTRSVGGRKCSSCGKKPAKVDDLCKKCARDNGILIKGKIGEG